MTLRRRLTRQLTILLLATCAFMGLAGYLVARRELVSQGETLLRNGVKMAMDIIKARQEQERSGMLTRDEAQERVKIDLLGPRNPDGTREIRQQADLGRNGYFIVYDVQGLELMHPTLEGQNMWEAADMVHPEFMLVQDQIAKALDGGGFTWYNWVLPKSEQVARKVTYTEYESEWGWVVCASSYQRDFYRGAYVIFAFTVGFAILSLFTGILLSRRFIGILTGPIEDLLGAMKKAEPCRTVSGRSRTASGWSRTVSGPSRTVSGQGRTVFGQSMAGHGSKHREDEIDGLVDGYNELMANIEQAKRKIREDEQEIYRFAYLDTLTNLPNRNLFKAKVEKDIADGVPGGALVLMDIRSFRLINTLQGEAVGDAVLRRIGEILLEFQSETRTVGRISGDEFGVWLIGSDKSEWIRCVTVLQISFSTVLHDLGHTLRLDVRAGYAAYPSDGSDFEHIYLSASLAARKAKGMSGSAVVAYDEVLRDSIVRVEQLKHGLEKAIDSRDFHMAYQEKVDPTGRLPHAVEALARWVHPGEGPVSPGVFVPIIEQHGLIVRFGEMVIELVMADFARLREKYGEEVSVSINIAPIHLFDANFTAKLFGEVRSHQVDPGRVILEITESIQIEDFVRMKAVMSQIRAFGIRFSLDDFGTGYSSLSYIFQLPIDELKIDRSFIKSLDADPNAHVMLGSICQMAKAYGLTIVAEGVETREQEVCLLEQGVDLIQGFLYSRPEEL